MCLKWNLILSKNSLNIVIAPLDFCGVSDSADCDAEPRILLTTWSHLLAELQLDSSDQLKPLDKQD